MLMAWFMEKVITMPGAKFKIEKKKPYNYKSKEAISLQWKEEDIKFFTLKWSYDFRTFK